MPAKKQEDRRKTTKTEQVPSESAATKTEQDPKESLEELKIDYWVTVPGLNPRWGQFHTSGGPKGHEGAPADFSCIYVSAEEKGLVKWCLIFLVIIFLIPAVYERVFDVDLTRAGFTPHSVLGISKPEVLETLDKQWGTLLNEDWPKPDFERWKEMIKSLVTSASGDEAPKKESAKAPPQKKRDRKKPKPEKVKTDSRQSNTKNEKKADTAGKKKKENDQKDFFKAEGEGEKQVTIEDFGRRFKQLNRKEGHKLIDASLESLMKEFDADEDGKIILPEILPGDGTEGHLCEMFPYWKDSFKIADADKDGRLTAPEFGYLLKDLSKKRVEELLDPLESIVSSIDSDKNGKISMQELLYYARDDADPRRLQDWMDDFKKADSNKDDNLSNEELVHLLNNVGKKAIADNNRQLTVESLANTLKQTSKKSGDKLLEDSIGVLIKEFDADSDGEISLKEILPGDGSEDHLSALLPYWKDGFNAADANKDGHLTSKEFLNLLVQFSKDRLEEFFDPVESIMTGFDTDKNGKINLEELMQRAGNAPLRPRITQGWTTSFKEADADGDGHLAADELVYFLNEVGSQSKDKILDPVESIMAGFDSNKDGKISLQELLPHADKAGLSPTSLGAVFKEADADGDGHLSVDELGSFLNAAGLHSKDKHEEL